VIATAVVSLALAMRDAILALPAKHLAQQRETPLERRLPRSWVDMLRLPAPGLPPARGGPWIAHVLATWLSRSRSR